MADLTVTHTAAYGVQAYALALTNRQGQGQAVPSDPTSPVPAVEQSEDQVSLSRKGKELSANQGASGTPGQENKKSADTQPATKGSTLQPLSEAELRQIQELKSRDTEVRAHEQAHLSAAGQYATGSPSYSYQTGADGRQYAVGGSVPIDTGKESTPEATIIKMRTVKRAALAPANPSPADRQIASNASMQELQAIQEEMQATQQTGNKNTPPVPADGKKNESPENPGKNTIQNIPDSLSSIKKPSDATRTMMSVAYKAMASLA
ncbi:MAG: putative metalloprotease CJM1_0395 family protein [Desulfocapsaceae bacterium]|nr:putative metalloprotease CJM1_0395 family protein [Desulfocapsaceae bacterium]